MNRFRFTLLAFCLVLGYLGWTDLSLTLGNPEPLPLDVRTEEVAAAPRQWLILEGGRFDVLEAISTSGSIELDALLIPLRAAGDPSVEALVETRRPELLEFFRTYHFNLDSPLEKEAFVRQHQPLLEQSVRVEGMLMSGAIESSNRDKLIKLAREADIALPQDIPLFSEGKTPPKYRGFFFAAMALLGFLRFLGIMRKQAQGPTSSP